MSVGRADANGAGSVSPPVPAPAPADSAASGKGMPKTGLADGANTTWSTARKSVHVAEAPKRSAALDFKAIDKAVDDLEYARLRFAVASRNYASTKNDETRASYNIGKDLYHKAQIDLGMVIDDQKKRAEDSSLYPRGHGLKNSGQVRQLEQKILDHAKTPLLKSYLAEAINENRGLRAPDELKALSVKIQMQAKNGGLHPAQKIEATHIIKDTTDAVIGQHWDEAGLLPDLVTTVRLGRLDQLLDGVTGKAEKFDLDLFDQVTANIKSKMYGPNENTKEFDDIVAKYRARLAPQINIGP